MVWRACPLARLTGSAQGRQVWGAHGPPPAPSPPPPASACPPPARTLAFFMRTAICSGVSVPRPRNRFSSSPMLGGATNTKMAGSLAVRT